MSLDVFGTNKKLFFIFTFCIGSYAQNAETFDTHDTQAKSVTNKKQTIFADIDSSVHDVVSVVTSPFHFRYKEWAFAGLSIAEGTAFAFDQSVRTFAAAQKTPARDRFIMPWQYYGSGYTAVAVGCGTYLYGFGFANPWWRETGRELLTALTIEGAFGEILKIGFGRYRPYTNKGAATFNPFSINEASASLPSGHTTTAFTVSSVLAKRIDNPYVSCGLYAMAFFTGCQRIYSDNHWFSDVIMGAILGTAIGRSVGHSNASELKKSNSLHWKIEPEISQSSAGLTLKTNF
jgi:membrane-associated phospholipid phosphatase